MLQALQTKRESCACESTGVKYFYIFYAILIFSNTIIFHGIRSFVCIFKTYVRCHDIFFRVLETLL